MIEALALLAIHGLDAVDDDLAHVIEAVHPGANLLFQVHQLVIIAVLEGEDELAGIHDLLHLLQHGRIVGAVRLIGVEDGVDVGVVLVLGGVAGKHTQGLLHGGVIGVGGKGLLPVALDVEVGGVPGVVGHTVQGHLAGLGLVHGVGEHAQAGGDIQVGGVHGVQTVHEHLVVNVVVDGVVPPHDGLLTGVLLDLQQVRVADGGPHAGAGHHHDDVVVLVGLTEGAQVGLQLRGGAKVQGVEAGHVVGAGHVIGGVLGAVVGVLQAALNLSHHVGLVLGATQSHTGVDVVHKHAELTHAQIVHVGELLHDVVNALLHAVTAGEVDAVLHGGVDGPGKGDVVLGGSGGDGAHVVLGHHAVETLLVGDLGGILIPPVAQVIGITLGAVDEGVHLVVFHVLEQGENVLHRVHLAVEALDDAAVLHVGIVLDGGAGQLLTGHGLHGVVQGGQAVVHGVVVLAQDGHAAIGVDVHKVGVILGLAGHKQVVGVAGGVGVHVLGRAVQP